MTMSASIPNHAVSAETAWLLLPVYEDWAALATLLRNIDDLNGAWRFHVLIVNDHPLPPPKNWFEGSCRGSIHSIRTLSLRRNVGHQRAIALGLCHWFKSGYKGPLVVLDADGEDRPEDIPRLLEAAGRTGWRKVVFASRQKRSENFVFRLGYHLYRHLHFWLTGIPVRFGNFSALAANQVQALVHQSELWNHYAAAVIRSRLPYESIPTSRGRRLAGKSRMNLAGWVAHGLSALSIFSDVAGTRVLLAGLTGLGVSLLVVVGAMGVVVWSGTAAAYWVVLVALLFSAMFLQAAAAALIFLFMVLGGRSAVSFIPVRDGAILLGDERLIWPAQNETPVESKAT